MTPLPSDADAPLTPDEERALREAWPRTAEALRLKRQALARDPRLVELAEQSQAALARRAP